MAPTSKAAAMQPVHTGYNSRQVALFSICVVFGLLSIATVGLRFYARRLQKINFYTSDWLTIPALILVLGHVASIMVAVAYGAGKHVEAIVLDDPTDLIRMAKTFIASGFPWLYATCLTKLSILQMYTEFVRIRNFRLAVWVVMGLVVAFCVGQTFDYAFNCQPFAVRWNPALDGSCSSVPAEEIGGAVTNMILDIIVILLPQPVIWKLKMSPRRKLLVSLVFSFGVIVIAITIVRVYYTVKTQMSPSEDTSWDLYPIGVTGGMESTMGLICACLPTLRPVFGRCFSRIQPSGQSYGDASKQRTYPTQPSVNGNQFSRLSEDKEHLAKDSFGDSSPERFHMTALPPRV